MNNPVYIPWGNDILDGLGPCVYMSCAVLIALTYVFPGSSGVIASAMPAGRQEAKQSFSTVIPSSSSVIPAIAGIQYALTIWQRIIFLLVYAFNTFLCNFGPMQAVLFQQKNILIAKVLYFILGLWALVSGVLCFKDWLLLRRGVVSSVIASDRRERSNLFTSFAAILVAIILAIIPSTLAAFWPIDNYIILSANEAIIKSQFQMARPLVFGYILICMWPLVIIAAILSIKNLRPSLLKIISAAVFLTASSSMILLFK